MSFADYMTPSNCNGLPLSNNPVPTESTSAEGEDLQHSCATPDSVECDGHEKEAGRILNHVVKVVNMGTAISETKLMDKWAASKRTQVSAILCIKLLPLLENALKLNFKALYETENLDPLQGPTHTLTPSSIHTQNRPQNYGWIYHLLSSLAGYSPKLTATLKNRGLATLGFQKKFHAHQLKPTQTKASFQKVNLPPAKIGMLFHVHLSGYRVLATHLLPLTSPVQLPNQPNSP